MYCYIKLGGQQIIHQITNGIFGSEISFSKEKIQRF